VREYPAAKQSDDLVWSAGDGEDFHAVPPVLNPETNWSLASSEFLFTTPPVPFPVIGIEVVQENGQVELGWASATEATYRLQSSPDLESWTDSVNHRHGFAACEQVGQVLGHQAHGALGYGAQSRPISP
jgi:hypothetical protein